MNRNIGIYCIKNIINSKIYIGSSKNISLRIKEHFWRLSNNKHKNVHLQKSFNKYGREAFIYFEIEFTKSEILLEKEQFWLDFFKSYDNNIGYNLNPKVGGGAMPESVLKRISQTHKKLGTQPPSNKGKKQSQETIDKRKKTMSQIGYILPTMKGKTHSIETKERMRQAKLNYYKNKRLLLIKMTS